ncbi:MAG: hypothetical protein ACJ8EL_05160 [Rhizomicrobium sp.]
MRQMISGMAAAVAMMAAAPAMACGYGPCVQPQIYVSPAPVYSSCYAGCGWVHERLPDPLHQYYYVNQGPTYTGPGNWAPLPTYRESAVPRLNYRYGYARRYAPYQHGRRVLRRYY